MANKNKNKNAATPKVVTPPAATPVDTSKKRVTRTAEERIAEHEKKIAVAKATIEKHEAAIEAIKNPKPRGGKVGLKTIISKAKEQGMTTEQIAKKLGIEL